MKLIIQYNKSKDVECWKRLVNSKDMFGHIFPNKVVLLNKRVILAKNKIDDFQLIWDSYSKFDEGIKKIYKHNPPKFLPCYINTTGFSMDNYPHYISISAACNTEKRIITMLVHELSHFIFRKYFANFCYSIGCSKDDIEEIKEIITVVNNDVFDKIEDKGYEVHAFYREKIRKAWKDGLDIEQIIILIQKLFKTSKAF